MDGLAARILAALDERRQIAPAGEAGRDLGLDAAYAVSDAVIAARVARGERPAGWKIGFTNRTIWDEYGVRQPIWGPVYAHTVHACEGGDEMAALDVAAFVEPRIEPEIVFRIARPARAWTSARFFHASTRSGTASRWCSRSIPAGVFRSPTRWRRRRCTARWCTGR